jgi:hypothetical protein
VGEAVERRRPAQPHEAAAQVRGRDGIIDRKQRVVVALVADAASIQLPAKPFVSVDVDLDGEG